MSRLLKNIWVTGLVNLSLGFLAQAQTLKLVAPKLEIEIRDPQTFKSFKNPYRIKYGPDEKEILKAYAGKTRLENIKLLVVDLKDTIDEKAGPVDDGKKVSDLNKAQREEIAQLGDLREQLALNWAGDVLKQRELKTISLEDLNKLLLAELVINVDEPTIRGFFCADKAPIKLVECEAAAVAPAKK